MKLKALITSLNQLNFAKGYILKKVLIKNIYIIIN